MAVDEALLLNFQEGDVPILRLYGWEPSLSLGRFSNVRESLNLEVVGEKKLSFVRRVTGGGVLVHGGDLSYSLVLPRGAYEGVGVKESYRLLCDFLLKFYASLGLSAGFACDLGIKSSKSNVCMAANEPYDIIVDGEKVGGNAQRYVGKTLFHHGSVPIRLDEEIFKDVFLQESGLKNMATLDKMGNTKTDEELSLLLVEAFKESFSASLFSDALTPMESRNADELLTSKYSQKRWNVDASQNEA